MRTITAELEYALSASTPVYKKRLMLYRRVWTGSAYEFDPAVDITDYLAEISTVKWKADVESFNEWKFSNCTLVLRNDKHLFLAGNPAGLFPDGTLIYGSKLIVQAGAVLDNGTESLVDLFTGYIKADPAYDHENRQVTLTVMDQTYLLEDTNAETISTLVTDELLGSGSGTEFICTNPATGLILSVKKGATLATATALKADADYTVSNLNQYAAGATIRLDEALIAGESLWVTYRCWHRDKTLEWIVAQCCAVAGVTETAISVAQFASDVKATFSQKTAADFDAGTDSDTEHASGAVMLSTTFPRTYSTAGNQPLAYGTFQFIPGVMFLFIQNESGNQYGYGVVNVETPDYQYRELRRFDADGGFVTLWRDNSRASGSSTWRISRNTAGVFRLWIDGTDFGVVASDNTYTTSLSCTGPLRTDVRCATGNGSYNESGCYTTPEIDGTDSLTSWGRLTASESKPTGTSTFIECRERDYSGSFSEWTSVAADGMIPSTKRVLQLRWTAYTNTAQTLTPELGEWQLDYYTSRVVIPVVNLTGLDCLAAIKQLAEMCAYQIGFNAGNAFVFGPRTTADTGKELTKAEYIAPDAITSGIERVYNHITVNFGGYTYTANPDTAGDSAPTSVDKYGLKKYTVSSGNFLPAENVDLAYAIAPTVYEYSKTPHITLTQKCRFLLEFELGDKLTVTLNNDDVLRLWRYGDSAVRYGQDSLMYWTEAMAQTRLMFYRRAMRVDGIEFDLENWTATFDLTEV